MAENPVTRIAPRAPHFHGHRKRLRERFREAGAEALSDYELLELVLFRALPRRDVKPIAKDLIATFGSFPEVISAPTTRLAEVAGMGAVAITELKIVHASAMRLTRGQVRKRPVLSSWSSVIDYCRTTMAFAEKEQWSRPVPRQAQSADRRRVAADRHDRSHARLSARSRQARAGIVGHGVDPRAQSPVGRSDSVTC